MNEFNWLKIFNNFRCNEKEEPVVAVVRIRVRILVVHSIIQYLFASLILRKENVVSFLYYILLYVCLYDSKIMRSLSYLPSSDVEKQNSKR